MNQTTQPIGSQMFILFFIIISPLAYCSIVSLFRGVSQWLVINGQL